MPFYRFECEKCGHRFEELVSYRKRDEVTCPACSGQTRVLVSACAAHVGSGSSACAANVGGAGCSAPASAPRFT